MDEVGYTYDGGGWYIVLPHGRIGPFIGADKAEEMTRLVLATIRDAYERGRQEARPMWACPLCGSSECIPITNSRGEVGRECAKCGAFQPIMVSA